MSNQIITNKHESILDLTPLRDVYDVTVVLRPRGTPGDSREVSGETAADPIIERVKGAGWINITAATSVAAAPASEPVPAALESAPTAELESAPAAELEPVAAVEPEPTVEPEPLPEPEPTPEPAPAKTSRSSRNK